MDPAPQPLTELSALEQRLLEAARHDRIPDALGARMAEGLGLVAPTAATSASVATSSTLGAPLFGKAALWGVLSVGLVAAVSGWQVTRSLPRPSSQSSALPSALPNHTAQAPGVTRAAAIPDHAIAAAPAVVASPTVIEAPQAAAPAPRREPVTATAAGAVAPADDTALRAEIALLDRTRDALREGDAARALRLLDQHHRRFTPATLAPEATALRVEALVQQGAYARAESMSQAFATRFPTHPLRERVSALVRRVADLPGQ